MNAKDNNTHLDETGVNGTGIEIPALSSKPKKWMMGITIALVTGYMLINVFWDKSKKEETQVKEQNVTANLYPVPKLQELSNPNSKIETLKIKESIQTDDQKLILLRQNAPIEIYSAKTTTITPISSDRDILGNHTVPDTNENNKNDKVDEINVPGSNSLQSTQPAKDVMPAVNPGEGRSKQVERLKHQDYLLLEGTMIPGILQTAVQSDLAGNLKAAVVDDIYAAKGRRILIPKGSSLLGHYSGSSLSQQKRIVVVWTRIIRPDGLSIKLQAEGTDEVGQAGLTGQVNHHYFARFGQASLLSLLGAGIASTQVTSSPNYTFAVANSFATTSKDTLQESMQMKSTITIKSGTSIAVYVNQDISFYDVLRG